MKRSDVKYGVLAGLCVLLTLPILGYVQKQAALKPAPPPPDQMSPRQELHRGQRRALYQWLIGTMNATSVMPMDSDRRVLEVALGPAATPSQMLNQARRIRQIMTLYFREGSEGAVTAIILRANKGQDAVAIRTGLRNSGTRQDTSWHIIAGSKIVD